MLNPLSSCQLCPRRCEINRLDNEKGFCGAGKNAVVYTYGLHFGEEPPISGSKGSGAIFFSYCAARCVYCQNYKFSQLGKGNIVSDSELAYIMLGLQKKGAHNVNLVTPTHFVPQIINAVHIARRAGFSLPIIYNTNGYELPETLALLEGTVDIYLPDMRYSNNALAMKYSSVPNYVTYNRKAVKIMYRQVGNLVIKNGIAKKGLIIRHLVLPNNIAGTRETLQFIKSEISIDAHISLMGQYYPVFNAGQYPEINRQIQDAEYENAIEIMQELGFMNGWYQKRHTELDRRDFLGVNL